MNVRTSVLRGFALLALSSLALTACDEKTPVEVIEQPVVVTVAPTTATINVGQTVNAQAAVSNATNTAVTWSSSNNAIATVSATGVIEGVAPGTAVVTAASVEDPSARGFITVTVNQVQAPNITLQLVPSTASVTQGDSIQLVSIVTGTNNTNVTYRSSAQGIATVSASGMVRGVAPGTAVITAISAADTTVRQTSTITVTATQVNPPVITITPTNVTADVGDTIDFVVNVENAANTAFTCRSSTPGVAAVVNGCRVAALANGTAVITAISAADTTRRVTAQITVQAVTQPSISISAVTVGGTPIAVNTAVANAFNVVMNVVAGSQTNIDRVEVRLDGETCETQTFDPPLAPTQGVAQITVVCNTAQLDENNLPIFVNGTYSLTAVAINPQDQVVATATYGNLILNNANTVSGTVVFNDNSLDNTDNNPGPTQLITGNQVWNAGSATVTVTPAIFSGNPVSSIRVGADFACDGAGITYQTLTIGANGSASFTFTDANHLNNANGAVCFVVDPANAFDANTLPVTLTASTGAIGLDGITAGPQFLVDNTPPTLGDAELPTTVLANNNYAGLTTNFVAAGAGATLQNASATDSGVGGTITYNIYAVPATATVGTQAQMAAAAAAGTLVTKASDLPSSGVSNSAYRLIVEAIDRFGNVIYDATSVFGVDLERPTIAPRAGSLPLNGSINLTGAANDILIAVTDTFSGPRVAVSRATVHRAGGNLCIIDAAGTTAGMPTAGCSTFTTTLTNIGGQTENADLMILDPATTEGFIVYQVWGVDRAGNPSADTLTFRTLQDVTDPTGTVNVVTLDFVNNTIRLQGEVEDNVDLWAYDTRFDYPGLGAAQIPDAVPFIAPVVIGEYGLPLLTSYDIDETSSVVVYDITGPFGGNYQADEYGFFAIDIAGNSSFTSYPIAPSAGDGLVGEFLNGVPTDFMASVVARADDPGAVTAGTECVSRSGTGCDTSIPFFGQVRVGSTDANPVDAVYFYAVHPGEDGILATGADNFNILLGVVDASAAFPNTGITDRTFTFRYDVNASQLPDVVTGGTETYRLFAIAVNYDAGSGVMSNVGVLLNVQD